MANFSAHDVAAEFRTRMPGVPVKKLHKLLYYCQGWHAAAFGEPLFHETISAWDRGPVIDPLWRAEKRADFVVDPAPMGERELNTIGYVLSRYGNLSGRDLEALTHSEPPWLLADAARPAGQSAKIPVDSLTRFFRSQASEDDDSDESPLDAELVQSWLNGARERLEEGLSEDTPEALLALLR